MSQENSFLMPNYIGVFVQNNASVPIQNVTAVQAPVVKNNFITPLQCGLSFPIQNSVGINTENICREYEPIFVNVKTEVEDNISNLDSDKISTNLEAIYNMEVKPEPLDTDENCSGSKIDCLLLKTEQSDTMEEKPDTSFVAVKEEPDIHIKEEPFVNSNEETLQQTEEWESENEYLRANEIENEEGEPKIKLLRGWFQCDQCSYRTNERRVLKRHLVVHSDIKPFRCSHCDSAFKWERNLKKHARVHSDIKPYKCSHCDSAFRRKNDLKMHLNVHSNKRPFKCPECDFAFELERFLKDHLSVHSNIKPFKCSYCDSAFKRERDLKSHLNVHSDIKPFNCSHCDTAFKRKSDLKRHLSIHSN